ncbi:MAG: tetratricopeptide repeat protein [Kofleriaceae bacterium]|nr:MAG: tetratricopeptide repeat protein [Kofleriaceae bacterium]MBZ0237174.1 tetratricopeptide repeat protein [Kofleriaceae bacterium]
MQGTGALLIACLLGVVAGCAACTQPHGDPKKSETRLALARDFLGRNELEAAEAEANKAIAYHPTNDEAYNVRGLVHYLRGMGTFKLIEIEDCLTGLDAEALRTDMDAQLGKAGDDFRKAVELSPDYGEAWSNLGVVANLMGEPDVGIEHLTQALSSPARLVNPGLTRAHLGWAYFLKGDHVSAAKELRQALQFQPGMCVATYRLGRVYFAREEWEKAAEQFQDVSDQTACQSQEAALYLMKARLEQGLTDDARAARDACLKLSPRSCAAAQCRAQSF